MIILINLSKLNLKLFRNNNFNSPNFIWKKLKLKLTGHFQVLKQNYQKLIDNVSQAFLKNNAKTRKLILFNQWISNMIYSLIFNKQ